MLNTVQTRDESGVPNPGGPTRISVNSWVPHDIILRDAWFPLAHSTSVKAKPVRRVVHSQPYYLWRENGQLKAAEFHPGVSAAEKSQAGFLTGGTGFYPVHEKYGYVWCWYGDPRNADLAHIPSVPYLPPEGGLPSHMYGTVRFDCASALSLENLIDLTHADFLHANVVGDEKSESEEVEVFSDSETITMVRTCKNKSVAPVMRYFGGVKSMVQDLRQVVRIYMRSHVALAFGRFRPGFDVQLFHPCVPETRDCTRFDFTMNTSNTHGPFRYVMPKSPYFVSAQDNSMTRPQNERYSEPTDRRDLHSRFDAPGQRYRQLYQEIAQRQAAGDYEYRVDISKDCSDILGIEPGRNGF